MRSKKRQISITKLVGYLFLILLFIAGVILIKGSKVDFMRLRNYKKKLPCKEIEVCASSNGKTYVLQINYAFTGKP